MAQNQNQTDDDGEVIGEQPVVVVSRRRRWAPKNGQTARQEFEGQVKTIARSVWDFLTDSDGGKSDIDRLRASIEEDD